MSEPRLPGMSDAAVLVVPLQRMLFPDVLTDEGASEYHTADCAAPLIAEGAFRMTERQADRLGHRQASWCPCWKGGAAHV